MNRSGKAMRMILAGGEHGQFNHTAVNTAVQYLESL